MKKNKFIILFIIFSGIIFVACDRKKVYEEYIEIDNYVWETDKTINFEFEITDTLSLYNIFLNIRHASVYPYNNLWLFITSSAPNGNIAKDTVEYILIDKNGRWLGDGLGDIWDLQKPWKQNVRFAHTGKYRVELEQAMRIPALPGIMDMGLRVEKIESR